MQFFATNRQKRIQLNKQRSFQTKGRSVFVSGRSPVYVPHYGNDTSVFRPEMWAAEAVYQLNEAMVYGSLVHRDFDTAIAQFGEIVHTRKPATFVGKRKQNDLDTLEDQDVTAAGIDVSLNQRVYVSFVLGDADRSLSFQDLVNIYLREAMIAQTRVVDQAVGGQAYQFLGRVAGGLGLMSKDTAHDYLLDLRQAFNDAKVPEENRWLGLASRSETMMQKTDLFKSAERIGDGGQALRNALLGRIAGWNTFLELNTPSVLSVTTATGTTVNDAATAAGDTQIVVTDGTKLAVGQWFKIAGDNQPLRCTEISTNTITFTPALRGAVAADAAVTIIATGLVNQASAIAAGDKTAAVSDGYPAGWMKPIVVDGTGVPKVGQLVSFTTAAGVVKSAKYCILQASSTSMLLDRPLVDAVANNDIVNYGPAGDYNFGFQRNAIALVNRPLALPEEGTGARAALGTLNNVALRVVMTYDGAKEGTRVTVSALFGVGVLDDQRGGVLLG